MASNEEVYKQIINIQKVLYDNHDELRSELDRISFSIHSRIDPLETKVNKHQHIFEIISKVCTWLIPSGLIVTVGGWLASISNHK